MSKDNDDFGVRTIWVCRDCGKTQNYENYDTQPVPLTCEYCGSNKLSEQGRW